jgi:hypothetical protein
MALTTFTGPVRSLNGFLNSVQSTTTGEYTNNFVINSAGTVVTSPAIVLQGTCNRNFKRNYWRQYYCICSTSKYSYY